MPPSSTAPTTQPGPGTAAVPSPGANLLGGLGSLTLGASPSQTQPQTQPGGPPAPSIQPLAPPGPTGLVPLSGAGAVQADPLAVLDDLFVAQENIQPGASGWASCSLQTVQWNLSIVVTIGTW